jgi:hypothetical protein
MLGLGWLAAMFGAVAGLMVAPVASDPNMMGGIQLYASRRRRSAGSTFPGAVWSVPRGSDGELVGTYVRHRDELAHGRAGR